MEKLELLKEIEILREEFYDLCKPYPILLVEDLNLLLCASNREVKASIRYAKTKKTKIDKKNELELDSLRAELYYYKTFIEFIKKYKKKIER